MANIENQLKILAAAYLTMMQRSGANVVVDHSGKALRADAIQIRSIGRRWLANRRSFT